jgi:hypothetical protein
MNRDLINASVFMLIIILTDYSSFITLFYILYIYFISEPIKSMSDLFVFIVFIYVGSIFLSLNSVKLIDMFIVFICCLFRMFLINLMIK